MILDDEPDLSADVETLGSYLAELRARPDFMLKDRRIKAIERRIELTKRIDAEVAAENRVKAAE
ncbi:hypothetical protein [Bradyrhizobium sp. NP1]|uniref:hypothetical protein n=1 Tax=Bradyrhizobium sp. NP1 TaxID=3049772 RepID=UPI0025A55A40|nr:hypothetical protein [Bradyrhizobium sp. NP1]WJR81054.1 hypothetical protein QOU61_15260 [Bradyrhizobium sp. NP1]